MLEAGRDFWEKTKYQQGDNPDKKIGRKPPLELEYSEDHEIVELPKPQEFEVTSLDLREAIERRTSIRRYSDEKLSLEELAYLLWCTQGVKKVIPAVTTFRTVPSAGACHSFETYLFVNKVQGLKPGLYRFLAIKHALLGINHEDSLAERLTEACLEQKFSLTGALTFFWTADQERMIWRYGERGYRYLLLDAGHICQNLYLSAQSLGCGACAIGAFCDDDLNSLLGLDGRNQFVVYGASLGKKVKDNYK